MDPETINIYVGGGRNSSHLVHGDAPLAQKARDNYRERSCKRVRRRKNGIYYIYVHKEGKKHRDE